MKTEMIAPRDLVAAIHNAFESSDACHCHGDGKLSKDELTRLLVVRQIIPLSLFNGTEGLTIREAFRDRLSGCGRNVLWELEQHVDFLTELTDWTFADLLATPRIGRASADEIEQVMASYGLLLKDGDPALLEKTEEDRDDEATGTPLVATQGTPEEITQACARSLADLGNEVIRDGASLLRFSGQVVFGGAATTGASLKRYIHEHQQSQHEAVQRIVAPWLALLEADRARRKAVTKRQPTNRPAVAVVTEGNLVRAAFGQTG